MVEFLCLDDYPHKLPAWNALNQYRTKWIAELPKAVETSVGRQVAEALQYTQSAKCLTLVHGGAGLGKSFAARAWCQQSAGLARYVEIPSSNDEISFFRGIAKTLGVSSSLQLKAAELRMRIEEVLCGGDLMLVMDEAHYAFAQSWQRYAMPSRVNWIMTALVNRGVAVALVTTPQFHAAQKRTERLTNWNSVQLLRRIGHFEKLPANLEKSELLNVAEKMIPEAGKLVWEALAVFARDSKTRLASMEAIVKRARWFAGQDGRQTAKASEVRRAMKERMDTFDNPLAQGATQSRTASATKAQAVCEVMAEVPPRIDLFEDS